MGVVGGSEREGEGERNVLTAAQSAVILPTDTMFPFILRALALMTSSCNQKKGTCQSGVATSHITDGLKVHDTFTQSKCISCIKGRGQ